MSVDVTVMVFGDRTPLDVIDRATAEGLSSPDDDGHGFRCAGFHFSAHGSGYYTPEDVAEAKEEGYYKPHMDRPQVRLECCTNMGWSWRGTARDMQFPVAHLIAQTLAMAMNTETAVHDPQDGTVTYYRRADHKDVHAALDGPAQGFAMECPNFCETRAGDDGPWRTMGRR